MRGGRRRPVGRWAWWQALRSCGVNGCVEQAGRCVYVCACVRARMQCWSAGCCSMHVGGCGACASGPPEWLVACACHALSHVRVCRRGFADSLSCCYGGLLAPCGASAAGRGSTRPV
jgi:hypothetical protein